MTTIKFGTSGWRGILAEDFTMENVRVVIQAIADYLKANSLGQKGLLVGYDSRFFGERFAHEAARILAGSGIKSFICQEATPTPVIAYEISQRGTDGAINFTASHNPYEYNGIKFSTDWGGPALPNVTAEIEKRANAMLGEICYREMPLDQAFRSGLVETLDPMPTYLEKIRRTVDLDAIGRSGMRVIYNPMYGAGRNYVDSVLVEAGLLVQTMNSANDPYFGGLAPDPGPNQLNDLVGRVKNDKSVALGLATDGDADRYGIVDANGEFVEPNYILALLYDYLIRRKGMAGDVARSVATSHFIDAVASFHGFEVRETPVGFKYIGEYISNNEIVIGGEESAGLSLRGHVPDKDGILACLLVAEMVAVEGKTICQLLKDLYSRVGEFHTSRKNLRLTEQQVLKLEDKLSHPPDHLAGKQVKETITTDGIKLIFVDGSWVLFRKSGTEPVVRVYAEAGDTTSLDRLNSAAVDFVEN